MIYFLFQRGSTALYLACNRQHTGIALMLLNAGCEMDQIVEVYFYSVLRFRMYNLHMLFLLSL